MTIVVSGGPCSGKTTFCELLSECLNERQISSFFINADSYNEEAVKVNRKKLKKIIPSHKEIREVIFKDFLIRCKINQILHLWILKKLKEDYFSTEKKIFIIEIPLVIEGGYLGIADKFILVKAKESLQTKRLMKKYKISKIEAKGRLSSQFPFSLKEKVADFVVNNDTSLEELKQKVKEICQMLFSP